jgi:molecular chaperone GrpE
MVEKIEPVDKNTNRANEKNAYKLPLVFNELIKEPTDSVEFKSQPSVRQDGKRPEVGQKEIKFDLKLTENKDPMYLEIRAPQFHQFNENIYLKLNNEFVEIGINNKDYYGYEEFKFPLKIQSQFTVGYFEDDILKLWLKKQNEADIVDQSKTSSMIWCNENILTELEAEKKTARENLERFHQVQLDYQNYLVKSKREKEETIDRLYSKLLLNILEVQDNFERALEASKKSRGKKNLITGLEMILKQLQGILACECVNEIDAIGKEMDPHKHEVFTLEASSKVPENTVIEVIQKGYMYKDKVLRLAKVKVAKPEILSKGEK